MFLNSGLCPTQELEDGLSGSYLDSTSQEENL